MLMSSAPALLTEACDCPCCCCELVSFSGSLLEIDGSNTCAIGNKLTWKFSREDKRHNLDEVQTGDEYSPPLCFGPGALTITANPPFIAACGNLYFFKEMRITYGCDGALTTGWIESRTYTIVLPDCESGCPPDGICTIQLEAKYQAVLRGRNCDECRSLGGFGTKGLVATLSPSWGPWQASGLDDPSDWSDGCPSVLQDMLDDYAAQVQSFPMIAGDEIFGVDCLDGIGSGCTCEFLGASQMIITPDDVGLCYKRNVSDTYTKYQISANAMCYLSLHVEVIASLPHIIIDAWQIVGGMQIVVNLEGPPGGSVATRQYTRCAKGEHSVNVGPIDLGPFDDGIDSAEFCEKILQFYVGKSSASSLHSVPPDSYDADYFCANADIPHGSGFSSGTCNVTIS